MIILEEKSLRNKFASESNFDGSFPEYQFVTDGCHGPMNLIEAVMMVNFFYMSEKMCHTLSFVSMNQ